MVHQLLLISTVPHSKYVQTEATLQAITGLLSPQPIATYSLITRPNHIFKPKFEPGKVNQIEQYYMKCITTWDDNDFSIKDPVLEDSLIFVKKLFDSKSPERIWTLQISDIPIAGKNQPCCAQTINESTVIHTHTSLNGQKDVIPETIPENDQLPENNKSDAMDLDIMEIKQYSPLHEVKLKDEKFKRPKRDSISIDRLDTPQNDSFLQFLSDLGYDVINQYWIKGVRFFYNDIVIEIFKIFIRDDNYTGKEIKLKLLDESNTFQFKAYINIAKSTNVDAINSGTKELLKLQDLLLNLLKLEIPDRMFMDSRVRN
jgi:mediator of RNA polymerase II transcription subunit 18